MADQKIEALSRHAKEVHNELRALINARAQEGNAKGEFGAAMGGVYAALRMASGQVLATLQKAGCSQEEIREWARAVESAVLRG